MTDLSIIIVCYKGWERLYKCLDSLVSFSGRNFKSEVIVVDNKSDNVTAGKIQDQFPGFRIIRNKINGGFANGCNLGAKSAAGEFILFLNPDTIATESEIEKLLYTSRQNPEFAVVSCSQVNEKGKESISYGEFPSVFNLTGFQRAIIRGRQTAKLPETYPEQSNRKPDIIFPDWVSGSVMLIRLNTFKRLGGFDEDFWMYFEDVDLCRRIRNDNNEIAFCTNISIEHNHGGSSRINLRTTSLTKTEVYISRHIYISKHKTGIEKYLIQTFLILNNIISGGIMALAGILFFFVPKVFSRTLICCRLISYYIGALVRISWISPRSVNFRKT